MQSTPAWPFPLGHLWAQGQLVLPQDPCLEPESHILGFTSQGVGGVQGTGNIGVSKGS